MEKGRIRLLVIYASSSLLGLILLIVLVSVLIRTVQEGPQPLEQSSQILQAVQPGFSEASQAAQAPIFLPEIVVQNEIEALWDPPYQAYREASQQWSLDQIREFWIDPLDIGTETLAEQNRRNIRDFVQSID